MIRIGRFSVSIIWLTNCHITKWKTVGFYFDESFHSVFSKLCLIIVTVNVLNHQIIPHRLSIVTVRMLETDGRFDGSNLAKPGGDSSSFNFSSILSEFQQRYQKDNKMLLYLLN